MSAPAKTPYDRLLWPSAGLLAAVFVYLAVRTMHWEVVWDQSVMHYIRFLMSRGLRPYSEIADMNMPGAYMLEAAGMSVFGWSDAGWRLYEFFLMAVLMASCIAISGPGRRLAGLYAALIFLLVHFSEGEGTAMERDEVMAVLLVAGTAFFFAALRQRKPWLLLPFGLLNDLAATLKPSGLLLEILLLGLLFVELRRARESAWRYVCWALLGGVAVLLAVLGFLVHEQALQGFLFVMKKVWPLYAKTHTSAFWMLIATLLPKGLLPLALFGAYAALRDKERRDSGRWEWWAIMLGMAAGAASYLSQARRAPFHRYTLLVFFGLWIGWHIVDCLKSKLPQSRSLGWLGVALLVLFVIPFYVRTIELAQRRPSTYDGYPASLEADLQRLGGSGLQGKVECLDMVDGCLRALFTQRLLQNTGSTGDMLLFDPEPSPAGDYYHRWYLQKQINNPADVVVLGNFWYQRPSPSFSKLDAWPAYAQVLQQRYVLAAERDIVPDGGPAYRIYLRKGSAALAKAVTQGMLRQQDAR